jgi:ribosomal protein L37E
MATAAGSTSQEYWRPSNPEVARVVTSIHGTCYRCGTDYPVGARYCHACGSARDVRRGELVVAAETSQDENKANSTAGMFGLPVPCLVFLGLGIVCAIAAALTGVIYREDTLVDWQAVQVWRIEWLLAAVASLLTGLLLKKADRTGR